VSTTKIMIVAGQEFAVPAETDNEAVRQQLLSMGFADVASASLKTSTRTLEGQEVPVIEFVKKAGTKGLTGADLAALIRRVPPTDPTRRQVLPRRQADLIDRLLAGRLTCAEVRASIDDLRDGLTELAVARSVGGLQRSTGAQLCRDIDPLPAAAADVSAW